MMLVYSALLTVALVLSAPWWLARMLTTERYREGLGERLGRVPSRLREAVRGFAESRRVVWVHAVSVGEVLAASRLVGELEAALSTGDEAWRVVVSTTTRTGQALARERFGAERVFYFPLDFAWAVRAYLRVLRPAALVLMESELWPRMLWECERGGIPVVVVNARVSDRSFARAMKVRRVWRRVLAKVSLWLVQSEEDARRLMAMGARADRVQAIGNLKYDVRATGKSELTALVERLAGTRTVVIAGSTTAARDPKGHDDEEDLILGTWMEQPRDALLIIAPRHPERFAVLTQSMRQIKGVTATELRSFEGRGLTLSDVRVLCLDTIGDLASLYQLATIAFVGGSLVGRGGHNPLEPAQFGVPVIMGPSFENFRDIVAKMREADAIRIVQDKDGLGTTLTELLTDREAARAMGERGRRVFEQQQGATARAVEAIVAMVRP